MSLAANLRRRTRKQLQAQSKKLAPSLEEVYFEECSQSSITHEAPSVTPMDASSVDSSSFTGSHNHKKQRNWKDRFIAAPIIDHRVIMGAGIFIFGLAMIWPPLILFFFYIASKIVPYSFRENDSPDARRMLYEEFATQEAAEDDDVLPQQFVQRYEDPDVHLEESYWKNSRGMQLSTTIMTPKKQPIQAVVCFCHGYSDCVAFLKMLAFQRLVKTGIAFVAIEYEGHGRSDGPLCLIDDWHQLIDDVSEYFQYITTSHKDLCNHSRFLIGESMGGAVAYSVYNRVPRNFFNGVVFICPMCKISDDMLPPAWIIDTLKWLIGPSGTTSVLGYLPIAPSKQSLDNISYKVLEKSMLCDTCPLVFDRNPRLATARELIDATKRISDSLADFDAPFLVIHGKADRVTDPALSQQLYKESKSKDKTIHLYDDMWHALTTGETDENIDMVFNDIIQWIQQRV